jgi:hypothetical protein
MDCPQGLGWGEAMSTITCASTPLSFPILYAALYSAYSHLWAFAHAFPLLQKQQITSFSPTFWSQLKWHLLREASPDLL